MPKSSPVAKEPEPPDMSDWYEHERSTLRAQGKVNTGRANRATAWRQHTVSAHALSRANHKGFKQLYGASKEKKTDEKERKIKKQNKNRGREKNEQ